MSDPNRPAPPDPELLRRAAAGEVEAFTEIYHRYRQVIYRFACAMTGCAAAAEDVTQDVFVALVRDLAKYDAERASFTTYLYGIVRNLSRERLRRDRRFLSLDALRPDRRASGAADPMAALEGAELAGQVRQALRRLPAQYRELILLCDLHGLSYADTALVVSISTSAVRSRLHRGRQLLRRQLSRLTRLEPQRTSNLSRCPI